MVTRKTERRRQRKALRAAMPIVIEQTEAFMREHGAEMADEGFDNPYIGVSYFSLCVSSQPKSLIATSRSHPARWTRRMLAGWWLLVRLSRVANTPGIVEFCNRLRDKSPDHAFYNEVIATRMFLDVGFRVREIEGKATKRRKLRFFDQEGGPDHMR
ncbi:MAG: hypothetical protein IPG56_19520 [Caulobacteraceae bacterium]|nr:hypothetical protein [Caulobacteraceae bacterium]